MAAADLETRELRFELRYEGDRRVVGTAMRYGDTAEFPWGSKERFEPGAFGDIADVILNIQHDRGKPVARTGGGGLSLRDSAYELRLEADLADTSDGNDALTLVRDKILRGFSIGFVPKIVEHRAGVDIIKAASLRNIAIVDSPQYPDSVINRQRELREQQEAKVPDEPTETTSAEEFRAIVRDELTKLRSEDTPIDVDGLTETLATKLGENQRAEIDAALAERDEAEEARKKAEEERVAAEQKAMEDRKQMEEDADARSELIVLVRPILPDDTVTRGMSTHDILVAAVGEEVEDAETRSDDYLTAKVEGILERREQPTPPAPPAGPRVTPGDNTTGGVNIMQMVEQRRSKEQSAVLGGLS